MRWAETLVSAARASVRSCHKARTNDAPSNTKAAPRTTYDQNGEPVSVGWSSAEMPWYAAKPAPSTKMPTAASRDQKYLAIP